jgi:flagellar biosynthesis protein FlhG
MTNPTPLHSTAPVYAVASGKGGVGKTGITLTMATTLAKKGKRVLLLDGDTGLANLDVQLNLQPKRDLAHVLSGESTLRDIALPVPQLAFPQKDGTTGQVTLLPGRAGHAGLANVTQPALLNMVNALHALVEEDAYDAAFIDVAAGIAPTQLTLCAQAHQTLLVTTPDPSAITDAYALIKLMWQQYATANARLIVNMASAAEGEYVHQRLTTAVEKFLKLPPLPLRGIVPTCKTYATAVREHRIAAIAHPNSHAVQAIARIATGLLA